MIIYTEEPFSIFRPPGKSYIMIPDIECTNHILKNGIFEKGLIDWSKQFCSKDKNFLDIGSHIGTYALNLAECSKHVYAFEAQEKTYYQLCGNIALNDIDNITAYHFALSSPDMNNQQLKLRIISNDGGGSSICDLPTNKNCISEEKVTAKALDSFDLNHINFIKIDTEGSELNVLKGAVKTLKRSKYPPILFEAWAEDWYKDKKKELFDFLESLGYTIDPIQNYPQMFLANHKGN